MPTAARDVPSLSGEETFKNTSIVDVAPLSQHAHPALIIPIENDARLQSEIGAIPSLLTVRDRLSFSAPRARTVATKHERSRYRQDYRLTTRTTARMRSIRSHCCCSRG